MIIIFINCSLFPFIDWIIKGLKVYETRNRNTLKQFVGKTVYFAETGKHKKPVVRCKCDITELLTITDKQTYNAMRKYTRIRKGSIYDWNSTTKKKCLYKLENVQKVKPFIPEGKRYGRIYMEV